MPTKNLSDEAMGYEGLNFESILQECLACGLFTTNAKGEITAATPDAERLFETLPGTGEIRSVDTLPPHLQKLIHEAQTGAAVIDRTIVIETKPSGKISLSVTVMPLSGERKNGVVVVFRNISSVAKLEHKLQRLDRLAGVGTLSASMAHEIKNALVPLRTFIDLLLEKNHDSELAETVRHETARIDSIVSHMLKFAAPAKPAFAPVHLHELLDHSLRLAQHRVASKVIVFNREFHVSPDSFRGDGHQLEQAFVNLLLNAVEAIGAEGTLTVSTELVSETGEALQLREAVSAPKVFRVKINDTGIGIAPENLDQIFTPFFTTKQNGTGLGLAVTRRIIEEHSGSIRVESKVGQGTTFTIHLPVQPQPSSR